MTNLRCIKHPKYRGIDAPLLSCKVCCKMFLANIDEENAKKVNMIVDKALVKNKRKPGFDPDLI